MAAPLPGTRGDRDPDGIKLSDGYQTLIQLSQDDTIEFWEKSTKPPGIDGGDEIDQTTMYNSAWRTSRPRALKTLTEVTTTVAYDPVAYGTDDTTEVSVRAAINREDTITVHYPDESTLAFFGYLKSFEPAEHTEGEQPEATVTFVVTNYDYVNHVEAGPVMTEVAGT